MPSIVLFDAAVSRGETARPDAGPLQDVAHDVRVIDATNLDALLAAALDSDAACIVLGPDPEAGLAVVRRLRSAVPDLAILVVDAPGPEVALAAAAAGAFETTFTGADRRLVTLASRRAAECTANRRELGRFHAQVPAPAAVGAFAWLAVPLGDARAVPPLRELEREAIRHALAATGGRVGQAAKLLGMGRATLYRRLATLDVVRGSARSS